MYNSHFGLERSPFKITPDTTLFYKGGQRGRVLEALVYAILSGEGIIKVVGEVGTGKTMLCRMLHAELPPNVEVVYLANPSLAPEEIHHAIAMEMGLTLGPGATRLEVLHTLQQHMLDKYARNEHVVVLVEEAQSMPKASLEEIRLLSNLETRRDKLLQVVLFGQPELDTLLSDPTIRQLRERITHSFQLEPLNLQEVREYVNFRLRSAGFKGRDVFDEASYELLARVSKGLSRRINILADKALLAAFAEDTHDVRRRHVKVAVDDSEMTRKVGPGRVARRSWGWPESVLAAGALLVVAAIVITVWRGEGFVLPGLGTSAGGVTTEQGKVPPRKSSAGAALAAAPEALAAEAPDSDPGEPDTRAKATDSAGPAAEAQAELGGGLEATLADRGVAVAAEPEPFRPEVSPSGERQRLEPTESGAADMPVQEAARSESEGGPVPTRWQPWRTRRVKPRPTQNPLSLRRWWTRAWTPRDAGSGRNIGHATAFRSWWPTLPIAVLWRSFCRTVSARETSNRCTATRLISRGGRYSRSSTSHFQASRRPPRV